MFEQFLGKHEMEQNLFGSKFEMLKDSKIIWVSQLGSPLAGFRIVIGFEHTQHAMAQGGVNRLGTELFKRGTSKELKRKSQFLGPPSLTFETFFMAI